MSTSLFTTQAQFVKSLAHPRRLEIIHLLKDHELAVSDIHSMLDVPQANVSQHLMILKDAGVVVDRRDGKEIYYSLVDPRIITASLILREVMIGHSSDLDKNDAVLKDTDIDEVTDLVCGMHISARDTLFSEMYDGKKYYFCASGCLKKFTDNPNNYVKN